MTISIDDLPLRRFDELLSEDDIYRRFSGLLGQRELRRARQRGEISYLSGKKGAVFYHPEAIAQYLARKETPAVKSRDEIVAAAIDFSKMKRAKPSADIVAEALCSKYSRKKRSESQG